MSGWKKLPLHKVAEIKRDSVEATAITDGTIYVGLENIESGGSFVNVRSVSNGELASNKFIFTEHHVLYGKLRPYLAKIARPSFDGVCSTDILPILPGPDLDRDYLTHFLRQPTMIELANSRAAGANLPRLSPKALAEFEIPLPPLAEQRRIATILDQAEALRAKRRHALAKLDTLTQSLFLELFGATLRSGARIPLGELTEEFRYGTSNKSAENGYPALRIPNVVGGALDLTDLKLVPVEEAEFRRLQLRQGDFLFVRTNGNPDFVGRCAVFEPDAMEQTGFASSQFIYASYLIRARLRSATILPLVLQEFLSSGEGRRELRSRCKTSAGQFNINTESLAAIPIPVPPITLQREFAAQVSAVERLKAAQRASLAKLDALFASLQHRAFRGEL